LFQKYKYHLALHLIIFIWGFTGILGKLIHLSSEQIVWYRCFIALVSMLIALKLFRLPIRISSKKHFWMTLGVGVLVAIHWWTFYQSIYLSTASLGILCLSTVTLHVTWLEPLLFGKKFSWTEFLMGLLVVIGIYIVSDDFKGNEFEAMIWGLISALCAALFSVFNAQLAKNISSTAMSIHEMGIGFLFLTAVLFLQGKLDASIFEMTFSDGMWLLFLGIVCTCVSFIVTIEVMKKLGAFTVALSINLEPVYTIILAVIILKEHTLLGYKFYIGATVILAVLLVNAIIKRKKEASLLE
jgi:drug/metabolite transporter (DMT)-like permease